METKRFAKNDEGFVCENCKKEVKPLGFTSRNHCPFCLSSKHVDVMPGDRASECGGIMRAVSAEPDAKRGFVIIFRCERCGYVGRNKAVPEAKVQPDDMSKLIKLTSTPFFEF